MTRSMSAKRQRHYDKYRSDYVLPPTKRCATCNLLVSGGGPCRDQPGYDDHSESRFDSTPAHQTCTCKLSGAKGCGGGGDDDKAALGVFATLKQRCCARGLANSLVYRPRSDDDEECTKHVSYVLNRPCRSCGDISKPNPRGSCDDACCPVAAGPGGGGRDCLQVVFLLTRHLGHTMSEPEHAKFAKIVNLDKILEDDELLQ